MHLHTTDAGAASVAFTSHLVAATLCLLASRRGRQGRDWEDARANRRYWFACALIVLAVGLNQTLDLHERVLAPLRALTAAIPAPLPRPLLAEALLCAVLLAGLALLWWLGCTIASCRPRPWASLIGVVLLLVYVGLRAASITHVASPLVLPPALLRVAGPIDLAGSACLALSALCRVAHRPGGQRGIVPSPPTAARTSAS